MPGGGSMSVVDESPVARSEKWGIDYTTFSAKTHIIEFLFGSGADHKQRGRTTKSGPIVGQNTE